MELLLLRVYPKTNLSSSSDGCDLMAPPLLIAERS